MLVQGLATVSQRMAQHAILPTGVPAAGLAQGPEGVATGTPKSRSLSTSSRSESESDAHGRSKSGG
jgi:hypothetical protein